MAVWEFSAHITGSIHVEIHADTEAEARQLLTDGEYEPTVDLCGQCSGYSSTVMEFPVQFSLDLDEVEELEFKKFTTKEGT